MQINQHLKKEFLGKLLRQPNFYGFGDSQYQRMLTQMKPLFNSFSPVKLTKKGQQVLEGTENFYARMRENNTYLGGSLKYSFLYNTQLERIHKL